MVCVDPSCLLADNFSVGRARIRGRILVALLIAGCGGSSGSTESWQIVDRHLPGALLSVSGTSADDVFVVGGVGNGTGPLVEHYDGTAWTRLETNQTGDLWWVFGFPGGPTYMGGDGGMILRYDGSTFTRMTTPGTDTVFGIWGATPDDMWAVGGGNGGSNGAFAWRLQGDTWVDAPGFPTELTATDAIWKMYGRSANDAWMIGTSGKAVHWDGVSLTRMDTGIGESLFTVHADADRFVAVGGFGTGTILENEGAGWHDVSPASAPGFIGACLTPDGGGYAVGQDGAVFERGNDGWTAADLGFSIDESFHSVWVDPSGGVWAAGGQVQTFPVVDGILVHEGAAVPGGLQ